MSVTRRYMIVGGTVIALAAGGAGAATALGGGDDGEGGATGPAADRARETALQLFPGGRANAVERDSEDGATWEVEVTRADGRTVDVRLDGDHHVVVVEADGED
jgi:Peptidase propeptide and YPEB domain